MFATLMLFALLPPEQEQWDTITVTAPPAPGRTLPPSVAAGEELLLARQPRSAAEVLKQLPGVTIRPNSRGESVARVRGAEERQTQVFLDGAPLAVPWDGRVDLSVIPAGLIGAVRATKGAVPFEFGTNAVAGAIDLETRSGGERNLRATASLGTQGFADIASVATLPVGRVDLTFAAAALTRDAEPVADLDALPFSQARSDRRTNTDLDSASLFAAARYASGALGLRAYVLHVETRRGIAPESDRDPAIDAPRYWRYPDKDLTQAALTATLTGGPSSARLTAWQQWFDQRIKQYTNASYSRIRAVEENDDSTQGARLVLSTRIAPVTLRLIGTAQTSRHLQRDTTLPAARGALLRYRQTLTTIGGEADAPVLGGNLTLGAAYDRSTNPATGDKPAQPAKDAVAFSAAWMRPLGDGVALSLSGGRRTRFPSARELFGEALGRFTPNFDLRPERAWLADIELAVRRPGFALTINPFYARTDDTIGQRVVRVAGVNRRQRFNLSGSESYGVDVGFATDLTPRLSAELNGGVLSARADAGAAPFRRLPQRPSYDVTAALTWAPLSAVSLRGEWRRVGDAVDLDPRGAKARLDGGDEINLRGRLDLGVLPGGAHIQLIGSVDNLTDDVITPQLGLPQPGRAFRIGVQIG